VSEEAESVPRKMCLCTVRNWVWLAFVGDEKECEEEERKVRELLGDADCTAMDIPRRVVFGFKAGGGEGGGGVLDARVGQSTQAR
jgi:hypothetical protein